MIGHNEHVAWATTARADDVQDLYAERVNPANPHQVERAGRWVDTTVVADPIAVKRREKPFPFDRETTPHGVIIASDRSRHLAFTIRWTGFEPGTAAGLGALAIDRATSAEEFLGALRRWKLPTATFVYATRDGVIGTKAAGLVPIRRGWNGALPAPGWTGAPRVAGPVLAGGEARRAGERTRRLRRVRQRQRRPYTANRRRVVVAAAVGHRRFQGAPARYGVVERRSAGAAAGSAAKRSRRCRRRCVFACWPGIAGSPLIRARRPSTCCGSARLLRRLGAGQARLVSGRRVPRSRDGPARAASSRVRRASGSTGIRLDRATRWSCRRSRTPSTRREPVRPIACHRGVRSTRRCFDTRWPSARRPALASISDRSNGAVTRRR